MLSYYSKFDQNKQATKNTQYSFREKDCINFKITHDNDYLYVDIFKILLRKFGQKNVLQC